MSENVVIPRSSKAETIAIGIVTVIEEVFGIIRDIKDPEKPETLEDLKVVSEDNIFVNSLENQSLLIKVLFTPTVSHCHLATLIVNKQINDKERVSAAMENENLRKLVLECINTR